MDGSSQRVVPGNGHLSELADVCALGFDVYHVPALTAGHEEFDGFGAAEAEVGTAFGWGVDGKAFDFCGAEDSAIGGALAITISQTLMTRGVW